MALTEMKESEFYEESQFRRAAISGRKENKH